MIRISDTVYLYPSDDVLTISERGQPIRVARDDAGLLASRLRHAVADLDLRCFDDAHAVERRGDQVIVTQGRWRAALLLGEAESVAHELKAWLTTAREPTPADPISASARKRLETLRGAT